MARIRSIKPEFWVDGKILKHSDSCALFYIGLWNFCDDEGKHPYDLDQLVAELGSRWHRGKVKLFIDSLINSHQLRINSASTWIQVVHWSNQRIDKPKQPSVKSEDIQWLALGESRIGRESSKTIPRKDRIGEDRIGEDRIGGGGLEHSWNLENPKQKKPEPSAIVVADDSLGKETQLVIKAYCEAYKNRYKHNPAITGKASGIAKRLTKDLGRARASELVTAYLEMRDEWFLKKAHDLETLEGNIAKVSLFLKSGGYISSTRARQIDRTATMEDTWEIVRRNLEADKKQKENGGV